MLCLSDMQFIKYVTYTKINLQCAMPLFHITKMVELLLLNHNNVYNIMHIKRIGRTRNCKKACVEAVGILEKSGCNKRFIGGDHDKTSRLG